MVTKKDFFEDLAIALEHWTRTAVQATTDPASDLQWTDSPSPYKKLQETISAAGIDPSTVHAIFSECFRGLTVAILTVLDGGTASAEKGRVYLVGDTGARLGEGLHSDFVGYLIDTGRLN